MRLARIVIDRPEYRHMKRILCLAASFAMVALPTSLAAQQAEGKANQEDASAETHAAGEGVDGEESKEADKEERKICKRIKEMGTRFSTKVCMTADEWEADRRGNQDKVREAREK